MGGWETGFVVGWVGGLVGENGWVVGRVGVDTWVGGWVGKWG